MPIALLGCCVWYLYLSSLPALGRNWLLAMLLNPFGIIGILCIAAHQIGVNYLRDRLHHDMTLTARLILCIPGRVEGLYKQQYGSDLALNFVRRVGIVAFGSLVIGALVYHSRLR